MAQPIELMYLMSDEGVKGFEKHQIILGGRHLNMTESKSDYFKYDRVKVITFLWIQRSGTSGLLPELGFNRHQRSGTSDFESLPPRPGALVPLPPPVRNIASWLI